MVKIGAEAVVLKQALTEWFKKTIFHFGSHAAAFANQMVVRVPSQLKLQPTAAEVRNQHQTKVVEQFKRAIDGGLVGGRVAFLNGREDCLDSEVIASLGQDLYDHESAGREPVAFLPEFVVNLGGASDASRFHTLQLYQTGILLCERQIWHSSNAFQV